MSEIAIVGSGIAGLGLAYYLRQGSDRITIYEKDDRLGGHANTVETSESGKQIPIDTGFMVFNHVTYPLLLKLFDELNVPTEKTDMSFSVQHKLYGLEYAGASFDRLFGDRKNIFNLRFWRMLAEIDRFNKEGHEAILDPVNASLSLVDYAKVNRYSDDFINLYLVPMSSALWSSPPHKMLKFPAITLLRFFKNHGLLGVNTQHQWWTVKGGSREYVQRLVAELKTVPRISSKVIKVRRDTRKVFVTTNHGGTQEFDKVVLACHADQALQLVAEPTDTERRLLSAFSYQTNETILHTDSTVMPHARKCWASWNYRIDQHGSSTHYWMNSLQHVSERRDYLVTLNGEHLVDSSQILKRLRYQHPLFDLAALDAQSKLRVLNDHSPRDQVFYCGSYFGYGFHEDALRSANQLAEVLRGKVLCQ
ncbi:MAG: FAD-dependent oxidoreductase [Cyanobacteria bacterium]|nr:FAD-dependent oxidoreductase [Cyanobacteriota bacterium]